MPNVHMKKLGLIRKQLDFTETTLELLIQFNTTLFTLQRHVYVFYRITFVRKISS